MSLTDSLLATDLASLIWARSLISPMYAHLVQISGELVVIYTIILLISLWLVGAWQKDDTYKRIALSICMTIAIVSTFYAIINLGIPKWRPGATEISGAIALIPHPIDNSFPSGHALFAGALIIALWRHMRGSRVFFMAIICSMITLSARILGGVHYPGDIIAGLLVGSLGALSTRYIVDWVVALIAPICLRIASYIRL